MLNVYRCIRLLWAAKGYRAWHLTEIFDKLLGNAELK